MNEKQYTEIIELSHSIVKLRNDGIIELYTKEDAHLSEEDVRENAETFGILSKGKKAPILIFGGEFSNISKEARDFMATEASLKYSLCEAFVLEYLPHKILISFYIKFNKPLVPTKVFKNKEKAIEWIRELISENEKK